MYFHNVVGTGSYITSTTNMYNNYFTYRSTRPAMRLPPAPRRAAWHCAPPEPYRRAGTRINKIEKNVSIDHTRHCIQTSNKNFKIYPRINSTFKVIRTCIFIMLSVLEGTQRVPPTCTIKTSRT